MANFVSKSRGKCGDWASKGDGSLLRPLVRSGEEQEVDMFLFRQRSRGAQMGLSNTPPGLFGLVKKASDDGQCFANTVRSSLPFRRPADWIAAACADTHMIQQLVKRCARTIMKRNDRKSLPDRQTHAVSSLSDIPCHPLRTLSLMRIPVELHPGRSRPVSSCLEPGNEWLRSGLRQY